VTPFEWERDKKIEDYEALEQGTYCGDCRQRLNDPPGQPFEQRRPCFVCGSLRRAHEVRLEGEVGSGHSMLDGKARHGQPGEVKPHLLIKVGDSYDRDTGRWLDLEQVVDRENKRYLKRLADKETGVVIREDADEPLSRHQPHTWRKPRQAFAELLVSWV
jgi:hypothetical protein